MNPHPTFFTSGKYVSREELKRAVRMRRDQNYNWEMIGRQTGVSARTAKRVWGEDEAERIARRHAAYRRACEGNSHQRSSSTPTAMQKATIYAILVIALLLLGAAVVFAG